jgi:hypothetical protein
MSAKAKATLAAGSMRAEEPQRAAIRIRFFKVGLMQST